MPDGTLAAIRERLPDLNPALRRIGTYVVTSPAKTKSLTIRELAQACNVSEATVSRFVRELRLESFQQMKILLAEELSRRDVQASAASLPREIYEDIKASDPLDIIIRKVHASLRETLDQTLANFKPEVVEQVVAALGRSELVVFFATGSSALAAENGVIRFVRVGKRCLFFHDQSVQRMSSINLDAKCLAIGISNSGRTKSTVRALQTARERGATTVCITSFRNSPITKHADFALITSEQSDSFEREMYREATTAKIGQIAIIDVLYSAYAVRHHKEAVAVLRETDRYVQETRV
ncbi:MAG TPA: MurR/RpiR family transcriptional regulator [Azospirillaceae bacterium]|nr:MurR/RpiR family transcriptional regulator [Azospirillaceae bacterium]